MAISVAVNAPVQCGPAWRLPIGGGGGGRRRLGGRLDTAAWWSALVLGLLAASAPGVLVAGQRPGQAGAAAGPARPNGTHTGDQQPVEKLRQRIRQQKQKKKKPPRPAIELQAIHTCPSDSIAYFKPNHWTQFKLDGLVSNYSNRTVELRSEPERLRESAFAVRCQRRVALVKGQQTNPSIHVLVSEVHRGTAVGFALFRPDGLLPLEPPGPTRQPCLRMLPHQFLMVALATRPDEYRFLYKMKCVLPGDEEDEEYGVPPDRRRYYHLVTPFQPTRPLLADSFQGWTTTSYVIWDDLDPEHLTAGQRQAMEDWLHWGGQLIVSGGETATRLRQSFLRPYLPADVAGSDLIRRLSELAVSPDRGSGQGRASSRVGGRGGSSAGGRPLVRPIYAARLSPRPGAQVLVGSAERPLVVERAVGRGRVVMCAFSLRQPELIAWQPGYETLWREVLLRQPRPGQVPRRPGRSRPAGVTELRRPDGTIVWVRGLVPQSAAGSSDRLPPAALSRLRLLARDLDTYGMWESRVAEWRDDGAVPSLARDSLIAATGIAIPPRRFVLASAALYLLALVPLNWLVCRWLLGRPEVTWLLAPLVVLAFSIGIVAFAEKRVGYDMICHELDLVEAYPDYGRGHLSRFVCVYSGSRKRCSFQYSEPGAVALPMSSGVVRRSQRIERVAVEFGGSGVRLGAGRQRYEIPPRAIAMARAEAMINLHGLFRLVTWPDRSEWRLENQTPLTLWDGHVVQADGRGRVVQRIDVGDLGPGDRLYWRGRMRLGHSAAGPESDGGGGLGPDERFQRQRWHRKRIRAGPMAGYSTVAELGDLSPLRLLRLIQSRALGPGTFLVGWWPQPMPGQRLDPPADRTVGCTIFVLHLPGVTLGVGEQ